MAYAKTPHHHSAQERSKRSDTVAAKPTRSKSGKGKKHKGKSSKSDLRDRIQVALAIADPDILKSLLAQSYPAVATPHAIGAISSAIGITTHHSKRSADGIIRYESVQCALPPTQDASNPLAVDWGWNARDYRHHTRCESGTQTLLDNATVVTALSALAKAGYSELLARHVLSLPSTAHHKSWWYALDDTGEFTLPFLRSLRTVRFADGTLTLKYKDYFAERKPPCFHSQPEEVLVEIRPKIQNFSKILDAINRHRQSLNIDRAILICDRIDDYAAQGFVSQGISLYPAIDLMLPVRANCAACTHSTCSLRGQLDSPVSACRQYSPPASVRKQYVT